jgi:Tol biopolymer transport system component
VLDRLYVAYHQTLVSQVAQQITFNQNIVEYQVNPNGTRIAFISQSGDGDVLTTTLNVIGLTHDDVRTYATDTMQNGIGPSLGFGVGDAWSPDGRYINFREASLGPEYSDAIALLDTVTGKVSLVYNAQPGRIIRQSFWSENSRLAFQTSDSHNVLFCIYDPATAKLVTWPLDLTIGSFRGWSDASHLLYHGNGNIQYELDVNSGQTAAAL